MAAHYRIDTPSACAVLTISGQPLSWPDFVSLVSAMIDDAAYAPGMPVLEDVRDLEVPPPTDCMRAMVGLFQLRADRLAGARWAMVVGGDHAAMYGLGRMAEILAHESPVTFSVFRSLEDAQAWLREDPTAEVVPTASA
ncbi:hypothetical protein TBR22_A13220 [Luteitalea sp. TBR-22]|uniref:hypothetical protein n=1 Tax=Luteitalea sp. TBR-22 TaxID=2802971 RepID=UPI001AFB6526|nr:hypothetical protein [Luteitalea sp. TBR-22]BCS32113.1 hypothetical protein TBR22_A13220 [Luteitalea sp. TBR-22]